MSIAKGVDPHNNTSTTQSDASAAIKPPGLVRVALEARAPFEYAASLMVAPWLLSGPRGDGHTVLVYPGFMGSDLSTRPMRRLLRTLGHDAKGWGLGRNVGPTSNKHGDTIERALETVERAYASSGRKVSLVGWSLGGLFARELAKRHPDKVRMVVTLGSPFAGPVTATNAHRLYQWVNRGRPRTGPAHSSLLTPPPVPTTSIFSRSDGVVAWQCSIQPAGAMIENIEVEASHTGLGVNPMAMYALADRLAQADGQWRPFTRSGWRQLFYPAAR